MGLVTTSTLSLFSGTFIARNGRVCINHLLAAGFWNYGRICAGALVEVLPITCFADEGVVFCRPISSFLFK